MDCNTTRQNLRTPPGHFLSFALVALAFALTACAPLPVSQSGAPVTLPTTQAQSAEETATPVAATESAAETATPVAAEESADTAALAADLAETIPVRAEGETEGFDGVNVFAADGPGDTGTRWVAHSYGMRVFQPDPIAHFVAIFDNVDGAWTELARIELECADYVDQVGVSSVDISPDSLWLRVDGGAGAHSGCFDLLRWDGATFVDLIQGFNASPGAGDVVDVDGDGQLEVVLNATEPYIFCYACGVRLYAAQILRWDGTQLTPVTLTRLPEDAPAELRDLNNRAVELAEADLYKDALPTIEEALTLAADDETVYWNAQVIRLFAENRLAYVDGGYPILSYVFYGDYAAAVDEMRAWTPAEIFDAQSPLIVGTQAEMWVAELSQYLISFSDRALAAQPDLAEAYFLRAWGRYLADPADAAITADLAQAAQLAPDDALLQAAQAEIGQ